MADDPFPPAYGTARGDDELVSAVLDGEATEAEVDRVRSDPALAARLEQFRQAASMLADPPPSLPPEQSRAMLEAALAAGRDSGDKSDAPVPAAPMAPLRPSRRVPPAFLVAAAVIVMVAVGLALVLNGRGGQNRANRVSKGISSDTFSPATGDAKSKADSGARDKAGAVPGAVSPHASGTQSVPTSAAGEGQPAPAYLGTFAGADQLRNALGALDPATLRPTEPPTPPDSSVTYTQAQLQRCAQIPRGYEQQLGQPLAFAYAKVNGDSVVVISFPLADQPGRIREVALGQGCTVPIFGIER